MQPLTAHLVPQAPEERQQIFRLVQTYVAEKKLTPPLSLAELQYHASQILASHNLAEGCEAWVMVLLNNALWQDKISEIPYNRRILLLPHCLRSKECPGQMDEMGLLCEECGGCFLGTLQAEAESLGYLVVIAEGTPLVVSLLQDGKIEAVLGVSCLATLEKSFRTMIAHATPGIAIPLYKAGCLQTQVDYEWIRKAISIPFRPKARLLLSLPQTQTQVSGWFEEKNLINLMQWEETNTGRIARNWLSKKGKKWRPLLTAALFHTLAPELAFPPFIQKIALAVECFHKASLIHDDIEDESPSRYGELTLHQRYSIPIALNIGDYLVGAGYDLLASCGATPEMLIRMLQASTKAHLDLCTGQGEELASIKAHMPLSCADVLAIFRKKTVPAFSLALHLGALAANAPETIFPLLQNYSDCLGVAYQIQDDLEDFPQDFGRPSFLLALAYENANEKKRLLFERMLRKEAPFDASFLKDLMSETKAKEKAEVLLQETREKAYQSLASLQNRDCKILLYRIIGKILPREKA